MCHFIENCISEEFRSTKIYTNHKCPGMVMVSSSGNVEAVASMSRPSSGLISPVRARYGTMGVIILITIFFECQENQLSALRY